MTVQVQTLSNGLRVATENMPSMRSAAIGIWVQAGGRHEREEQNGVAHFLEHMAFKGTRTRSALAIAEAIEDVGGYINAYTGREMTAYYARVLEADVPLALDVIADILMNPAFDDEEIEVERHVILQEIGQALDTPDDIIFDWLQEVAYPGQPMGRSILGPAERVAAFSKADLKGFVSERYRPAEMMLCAAGAVDHDEIVREAERLFGHLPASEAQDAATPASFSSGERRELKKLEQVHFTLGLEGPHYRDDRVFAAQVYSMALGGGMSSRLFQKAREEKGLCYTIFAQAGAYADTGMLTIYAGTSEAEIAQLAELTATEIRRSADDMSEAELNRAKAQILAGMMMGLESPSNRAERLARMLQIWGRVPSLEEAEARIRDVTLADLKAHAATLGQQGMAMALYGPAGGAPELGELRRRLAA
ncbi:M16 family metallopeptidase [Pseudoroseicyclus tamaricis]|uniref:Insulinase family protein n=1 Tax=Pseudoroseicyclus tamaricis TaxID=2705421 RepID=A0A6B2K4X4_9RHOB|nr:pitrilysin family protein [Pseudoroseicyclus tamaricis]NDV01766.1 insulinase family protein [Pseudoroseicyclus tamaricis]